METFFRVKISYLNSPRSEIRGQKTLSLKGHHMENILGFLACVVSAAMTLYSMKINHRPHPNEWVWLSANKTLFVDTEI